MVETSVAVATPSTTAARITNGRTSAGSAITKAAPISAGARAAHAGQVVAAVAPPDDDAQRERQHQRRAAGRR